LTASIAALNIYPEKSGPGQSLKKTMLITGLGIGGNFYQGCERQICLLTTSMHKWIDSHSESGLCLSRFKENILIDGISDECLSPDVCIRAGETVLRISNIRKECYPECALFSQKTWCPLAGRAVFATVESGGAVRIGDSVSIIK